MPGSISRFQMRSIRSDRNRRTGAGPPWRWTWEKKDFVAGQLLDVVGDAHVSDVPARSRSPDGLHHGLLGADGLDDRVCAETAGSALDPGDALVARSSTMSVAPNSRARAWRSAWRLIAMIRSAPSCLAARTPRSPTAPSPTTATVFRGAGLGSNGGEPAGAEHVGGGQQAGDQVVIGHARGGDQGPVGVRDARSLGLGADAAVDELGVHARDW